MAATVDSSVDITSLLDAPLADLMARAAARRDAAHGARITFSPKVFIPLTMLCRDKCGYCTFAKPPAHLVSPYLGLDEVLAIARRGADLGCHEALFTLGEAPEDRYPDAAAWLAARGYPSTVDYLVAAAAAVLAETGLLPHANAGALTEAELTRLRAVSPSQGMMIETLAERLGEPGGPHAGAPDKTPARRLATLEAAGRARVPFTTGILVGIGETRQERLDALLAIEAAHARHGHVQEVIVQNFLPKTGTSMWRAPACPPDEFLWTIAAARLVLEPSIHLQAPPNLSDAGDLAALVAAGTRAAPRRHRVHRPRAGAAPDRLLRVRARRRALVARRRALRGALRVRPRGPRARRRLGRRQRRRPAHVGAGRAPRRLDGASAHARRRRARRCARRR